tara:strand:+ start:296 stop:523 length:228 start_codon:yes stop_codon:yes gene_type:complete
MLGSRAAPPHWMDMPHPPVFVALLADLKVVLHDHRHPWSHIHEAHARAYRWESQQTTAKAFASAAKPTGQLLAHN